MQKEVLDYIDYLRSRIKERPQCMMLAMLLKIKFDNATLFYNNSYLITLIKGKYYDWDGIAERTKNFSIFPDGYGDSHIINHYNAIKERFNKN